MFAVYRLMAECQDVVIRVLSTPDGRYLGTLETLLKFPQPIEALSYEIRTEFAQKKLDSFKEFLESRVPDGGDPSAPASIMQTTNQPSLAPTSSSTTGSSGTAPNIGTALPMLSCPPLTHAFKTVWQRSKTKTGVSRTDPDYDWRCCFEEIVSAKRTLVLKELNRLFEKRLEAGQRPGTTTGGHEHWFRHNTEALLQLFAAAKLEIAPGAKLCSMVCSYWNKRRAAVLVKLTEWVQMRVWEHTMRKQHFFQQLNSSSRAILNGRGSERRSPSTDSQH